MPRSIKVAVVVRRGAASDHTIAEQIRSRRPDSDIRTFGTLSELFAAGHSWFPDLGVIAQSWPDEFSRTDVLDLMKTFPLTRWVCSYGPWCDSDGRNRDIWPAAFRVSDLWTDIRLDREAGVLNNSLPPLAATASLAEIFGFHFVTWEPSSTPRRLAVVSPDRAYRHSLGRLLETSGHRVIHNDAPTAPFRIDAACNAIVWDCDPWIPVQRERLNRCEPQTTPVIGLVGLPIEDDLTEMRDCGIAAIVPKLAPAEKLLAVVQSVTASPAVRRS